MGDHASPKFSDWSEEYGTAVYQSELPYGSPGNIAGRHTCLWICRSPEPEQGFWLREKDGTLITGISSAKILYDGKKGDIINQYIAFCRVFDEQTKIHGRTMKAVEETIRICKDKDVLREYLADREVAELMFGYFNMEEQLEFLRQEEREEGRAEGALRTLANLVKKGRMTPAEAAEEANMTVAEFEKQAALLYA